MKKTREANGEPSARAPGWRAPKRSGVLGETRPGKDVSAQAPNFLALGCRDIGKTDLSGSRRCCTTF